MCLKKDVVLQEALDKQGYPKNKPRKKVYVITSHFISF